MDTLVRNEQPVDAGAIGLLTTRAFATAPHSSGTEAAIVEGLRSAGALAVSLVAVSGEEIVGHIAFSPVEIEGDAASGWFGLGPVSVVPERQGAGIGSRLVRAGLDRLAAGGAAGCVLVGDPAFYGRFGFRVDPALRLPGIPAEYFQAKAFGGRHPAGVVRFHPAFGA